MGSCRLSLKSTGKRNPHPIRRPDRAPTLPNTLVMSLQTSQKCTHVNTASWLPQGTNFLLLPEGSAVCHAVRDIVLRNGIIPMARMRKA